MIKHSRHHILSIPVLFGFYILIFTLMVSCGGKHKITIQGTLENGAGKVIYIEEMTPEARIFLDSITLDNQGRFRFTCEMPYKTFYNLHINETDYIVLLPDYGKKEEITGNYDSLMATYTIDGSHDSQLLWQLQKYTNDGIATLQEIGAIDRQNRQALAEGTMTQQQYDEAHAVTDSIYLATYFDQQQYACNFIESNAGSLATVIALYKPFNVNKPLIEPEDGFAYYEAVLNGLETELPDNPHTLNFKNTVEHLRYQYARQ